VSVRVRSRAHRILRDLDAYSTVEAEQPIAPRFADILPSLEPAETLVGIYENHRDDCDDLVALTDKGILIWNGGLVRRVEYSRIDRTVPPETKEVRQVRLRLSGGLIVDIPITGGEGHLRDAFAFYRFLDRVVEDLRSSGAPPA
jgi:hypothetical protein